MKNSHFLIVLLICLLSGLFFSCQKPLSTQVTTESGVLEGIDQDGVLAFLGIPFAEAPVGELRWQAPQPKASWSGVREAKSFGPDPMQLRIFSDMVFRGPSFSEDCLYLNVWTAAKSASDALPVLIYFNGGGLMAGSGSEPRYDGGQLAREGVVTVTANYREGYFGFFAHPELSAEASYKGSGNYGFLDQVAAIEWVRRNISAFGGDANRITIVGESAGSFSVSLLMVSPLSKNLIAGAMLSSGADVYPFVPESLAEAEQKGVEKLAAQGINSISEARAIPADSLQSLLPPDGMKHVVLDGYFMSEAPDDIWARGDQANVPLLAGWNSNDLPGLEYVTWRVARYQAETTSQQVYRYYFTRPRPALEGQNQEQGAVHSADIEYAMGNLSTNPCFGWKEEDFAISTAFMGYYANFCKTGNPNGEGEQIWMPIDPAMEEEPVMQIDVERVCRMEAIPF